MGDGDGSAGRARGERLASDRVFGVLGGLALLLAAVFFVRSLLPGGRDEGAVRIPRLVLLSPAPGAEVAQPAVVELDAGARLVLRADGWSAGGRHLHLFVGGTELMAAGGELAAVGGTRYRWTLPRLPAGPATLRLAWSGADHRTLAEGASAPVPVRLR
ncbi:MAG TPA: hypothetical protein VFQ45_21470 [Longimicrobium sp.]|nr:hypothetical protein [Longimicrobium sp.]